MLSTTLDAVKAILSADLTNTDADRKRIMDAISNKRIGEPPPPRAYTPAQVAELLGKSRRTVCAYARRGLLIPIYSGAEGKRAQAYSGASVVALLSGKAKAKESEVTA